ncbi:MAG: glycoside hydrolase family 3 N-terminal domain-containing protein [Bacteroidota bacterium]|nr:glycoside hydrolase family 3 N-terminal domain-containing protein [Bacteroidota bacterium]
MIAFSENFTILLVILFVGYGCSPKWTETDHGTFKLISNEGGQTLGYSATSGVQILTVDRLAFKDLNKNGTVDPYEDWRLPVDERAKDLATKMSVEQIAGLMLYSGHQAIPVMGAGRYGGTYNGKPFKESGASASDLSDQQKKFLTEDNLRHVLITSVQSPAVSAQWNNNAQALVEGIGLGIPANNSSDPRHGSDSYAEFNAGAGGKISMWPGTLGIAAAFDPELMKQFGEIAAAEYRALGIATALSPQIDLGTEPRWSRFDGTMGEDPNLATDMARAYVDGFQTSAGTAEIKGGWGYKSVNAMVKHWPGGGPEEGGRDGHFGYGAYAVYPGKNLNDHLKPFTEGAFKLEGATKMASAVMPYYTISYNQDTVNGENVGNAFNKYLITDLLRGKYGYEGVVCTDWMITKDVQAIDQFQGKCWGVENMTEAERHYKAIEAGVDQFGGNNEMGPVIEAYKMGVTAHGEELMRQRFEQSAVRLLRNIFRVGLFENPYLDVAETEKTVGNPDFMKAGYDAQLRSVVMLKNQQKILPLQKQLKVYIPKKLVPASVNWFGIQTPENWKDAVNPEVAKKYFEVVEKPEEADIALICIDSPKGGVGYSADDAKKNGSGYVPISLQYGPYKADFARETSLAGGSPLESFTNRSYKGKTTTASNIQDMKTVNETKAKMGAKPVIVIVKVSNPMVFSEIEKSAGVLLIHMGVQDQTLMDIITGAAEPSALLPFQMPADMKTVEEQFEDVPRDMKCYVDSEGNTYDFAFGLNWNGVINDARVEKYRKY